MKHEEVSKRLLEVLEAYPDWDTAFERTTQFLAELATMRCEDCGGRLLGSVTNTILVMKEAEDDGATLGEFREAIKDIVREGSETRQEVEKLLNELDMPELFRDLYFSLPPQKALKLLKEIKLNEELTKRSQRKGLSGLFSDD